MVAANCRAATFRCHGFGTGGSTNLTTEHTRVLKTRRRKKRSIEFDGLQDFRIDIHARSGLRRLRFGKLIWTPGQ